MAGIIVGFITWVNNTANKKEQAAKKQRDEELLMETKRLIAIGVLLQQSSLVGDSATEKAILNKTYDGELPVEHENGSWSSPYPQIIALPIAGINYRSNVAKCVGSGKARLVPDPKNEFDPNAIKVVHESGNHVGFIPSDRTNDVCDIVPCYALCKITEEEDAIDHHHYFRGWIYVNTQPNNENQ